MCVFFFFFFAGLYVNLPTQPLCGAMVVIKAKHDGNQHNVRSLIVEKKREILKDKQTLVEVRVS